ncbi:MAG: hypothetical protein J0I66_08520, partial [Microbacterium sp.]|nr:hypothetical protein [Microbacterium sp.]
AHDADQRAVDLALTADGERAQHEAEDALAALIVEIAGRTPDPTATLAALAGFGDALERRQADAAASRAAARATESPALAARRSAGSRPRAGCGDSATISGGTAAT